MKIFTDAMREVLSRRINRYADMTGYTIKNATKYTNSDGGVWLVIHFINDYWMMFEPVRFHDNEVNIHVVDDDHFYSYEMYILFQLGICSKEVYEAEHELQLQDYHTNVFEHERLNILKWLPNHPEVFTDVSEIIGCN